MNYPVYYLPEREIHHGASGIVAQPLQRIPRNYVVEERMKAAATLLLGAVSIVYAQIPNPTQQTTPNPAPSAPDGSQPIFKVTVVSRTIPAINYHHRNGMTKVDLHGTELMPMAKGTADVASNTGATRMTVRFEKLDQPSRFGPEFLTFVLWAITPEGRAKSIGEVMSKNNDGKAEIVASSDLQSFGMIVTAEPYWAVTQPSDVVVMENFIRPDTTGTMEQVNAKYDLLKRGTYTVNLRARDSFVSDIRIPLQLREARMAMDIARAQGAEHYAADTMHTASVDMQNAEDFYRNRHLDAKALETNAREATQMAEDARIISVRREEEETLAAERADAAAREQAARERAAAEALARQHADEARAQADADRAAAEKARADAQMLASQAEQDRHAAELAKNQAMAQQQQAQADAERARLAAQQAEAEKQQIKQKLLAQLNMILQTRDSARGLIMNMSDVLFDFDKATLKPGAREALAKLSGILLAYPGLKLAVEGHTDSIGGDEYNLTLSEKRADAVRDYLVTQNVPDGNITAQGFGKANPVASNDTNEGRAKNRRVELVVSGEINGQPLESPAPSSSLTEPPVRLPQ
jgi:outer membrane protein OmpA-like peptidoglycan-associated protein